MNVKRIIENIDEDIRLTLFSHLKRMGNNGWPKKFGGGRHKNGRNVDGRLENGRLRPRRKAAHTEW